MAGKMRSVVTANVGVLSSSSSSSSSTTMTTGRWILSSSLSSRTGRIIINPCAIQRRRRADYAVSTASEKLSTTTTTSSSSSGVDHHHDDATPTQLRQTNTPTGLSRMPTSALLRNLLLGLIFTNPLTSRLGLTLMHHLAHSRSKLTSPDANPLLRSIIKPLVYDQFCAGTNQKEIFRTRDEIRRMGYSGVILCYGKEIHVKKGERGMLKTAGEEEEEEGKAIVDEVAHWRDGNLETLDMVGEGDWLGIKLTGAGPTIVNALLTNQYPPPPEFSSAMDAICAKAAAKKIRLWIDAEQQVLQASIDAWTIDLMRKHNRDNANGPDGPDGGGRKPLVYNTVQAYLKTSRTKLQHQIRLAQREGWTLGVKLVRGAYIASDERGLIHDTKRETDESYDGIVRDLLRGNFADWPREGDGRVQVFLAGHNPESVRKAWEGVQMLRARGELRVCPDFGQLQGMADHLGCGILQRCDEARAAAAAAAGKEGRGAGVVVVPKVYKCLTWGSVQECMQYLYRRVVENKGGADRMRDGMEAYWGEVRRRVLGRGGEGGSSP